MNNILTKQLTSTFKKLDGSYSIVKQCKSNSVYVSVLGMHIRISDHFKKNIGTSSSCHIHIIKPIGSKTYLVSLDKSLFYVQMSYDQIEDFIRHEAYRKSAFFPSGLDIEEDEVYWDTNIGNMDGIPVSIVNCNDSGVQSAWKEYHETSNIKDIVPSSRQAQVIRAAYLEADTEYNKGDNRRWADLAISYKELVKRLKNKNIPESDNK